MLGVYNFYLDRVRIKDQSILCGLVWIESPVHLVRFSADWTEYWSVPHLFQFEPRTEIFPIFSLWYGPILDHILTLNNISKKEKSKRFYLVLGPWPNFFQFVSWSKIMPKFNFQSGLVRLVSIRSIVSLDHTVSLD